MSINLQPTDEQTMLVDTFARFFAAESTMDRVRANERTGFDPELWKGLAEMGALTMRSPESAGGGGLALMDAVLIIAAAGHRLVSAPLAEAIVASRLLGLCGAAGAEWRQRLGAGDAVVTLALNDIAAMPRQLVQAGAVADAVIALDADTLVLVAVDVTSPPKLENNLGSLPFAVLSLDCGERIVLARGAEARRLFEAAIEEWKLLHAAFLNGIVNEGIAMAAAYAGERTAFGKPIGSFQAVAHPLADAKANVEGARLLCWWAVAAIATGRDDASALVEMAHFWARDSAGWALQRAVHTFGGFGLSVEYDIQLYYRRAKALALVAGNPADALQVIAGRLWGECSTVALPDVGNPGISFDYGEEAEAFAAGTRALFKELLTPDRQAKAHFSFEGHDWDVFKAIGATGRLYPSWPKEFGGLAVDDYASMLSEQVWDEFRWSRIATSVSDMVGHIVMWFGSDALKNEVLLRLARGEASCSLGYSEPSGGSDVFAARTTAIRDGDDWVINGQKMWTSGVEIADYILLLTRTDPEAAKHRGLTVFLVPTSSKGFEAHPIHTFMDERTNTTFYTDLRLSDHYRLGEVNGGTQVLASALRLEQGGGGWVVPHRQLIDILVEWSKARPAVDASELGDARITDRVARAAVHAYVADAIARQALWATANQRTDGAYGPMSKLVSTEYYLRDSTDFLDLTAPESMLTDSPLNQIDKDHRRALATTVYGGTTEVQRSMVAERILGMPRSRS